MTAPARSYAHAVAHFDDLVAAARTTLTGFSACVDVVSPLDDRLLARIREADPGPEARAFAELLLDHAHRGRGGERCADWSRGPAVLREVVHGRRAIGGTGAQAAQTLAAVGAPALLCLADRSPEVLELLAPDVLLVDRGRVRPVSEVERRAPSGREPHHIFEFTAGTVLAGSPVPRSSRVIVRFGEDGPEEDAEFDAGSVDAAAEAGGAVVSGFNAIEGDRLTAALARVRGLVARWRAAGLDVVHLELGTYAATSDAHRACEELAPVVSSIGMSRSELDAVSPGDGEPEQRALRLARRYDVEAVIVHGDRHSFAVTSGDAERLGEALLVGSLCAASRAAQGAPARPAPDVLPLPAGGWACEPLAGGRTLVSCPSPYLPHARSTIGLGDTFVAGLLLALGASTPVLQSQPARSLRP